MKRLEKPVQPQNPEEKARATEDMPVTVSQHAIEATTGRIVKPTPPEPLVKTTLRLPSSVHDAIMMRKIRTKEGLDEQVMLGLRAIGIEVPDWAFRK